MRLLALLVLVLATAAPARADERLEKLVGDLRSEDQTVCFAAYNALQREIQPVLVGLLQKTLPDCSELGQYYGMLVMQRQDDKVVRPALRKLLAASSTHLRVLAAAQLCRLGEGDAAKVIATALEDADARPEFLTTLLSRIYGLRDEPVLRAVRGLLRTGGGPNLVATAIYQVYLARDTGAAAALRALGEHADDGVRMLAAACRLVLGEGAALDPLCKALAEGRLTASDVFRLKNMLQTLRPAPTAVLETLAARLEGERDATVLRPIVDLLGEHGYTRAVDALRKLLDHPDANVSKAAFEALAHFPGALSGETLRGLLTTGDDARRLAAADALRRADDETGFDEVVRILREGARDMDRWEAARVLGSFRSERAVEPLLAALEDGHDTVRVNALNGLATVFRSLYPYRRFDLARTGYVATGDAAARRAALARLRAWWESNRAADW